MKEESPLLDIGVFGIRSIPSTYSGYETFLTAMLPILAAAGHQVTVYVRSETPDRQYKGVRLVAERHLNTKSGSTLTHGLTISVRRGMAHDVCLIANVANSPFAYVLRKRGIPSVLNVDGMEWERGKWGPVGRTTFRLLARFAKHASDCLIADCEAMQQVYWKKFRAPTHVIPYAALDLLAGTSPATSARLVRDLGLEPRSYILIAGRLVPENQILETATSMASSNPGTPVVVVGNANYDSPVQRGLDVLARSNPSVQCIGHVSDRASFGSLLRHASIYVHGHSVGGMNPSLLEAMRAGAAIAAFDTPFNRETLGEAGLYFKEAASCGPSIQLANISTDRLAELREMAQRRAEREFDLKDVTDMYIEALRVAAAAS